jgi:ubiquinol-cytochrome c reductase cytochrome c1 subunit
MRLFNTKGIALVLTCLVLASPALRAEDEVKPLSFREDTGNVASVQRGARDFMAYCSGCHSMKYLRYNRIGADLGISDELLQKNLIFSGVKVGEPLVSALPAQAEQWFGRLPPDLTLETKARGSDWVYSYLMGFYLDSSRPFGVNNLFLPGVSMPAVLGELQGWQAKAEPAKGGEGEEAAGLPLKLVQPGSMTPEQYKAFVTDLTNFMVYAAEPVARDRISTGWKVIFYLVFLLLPLTYFLKKEFWKDVH